MAASAHTHHLNEGFFLGRLPEIKIPISGPPGSGGFDLVSLNIQRGRDHGLADYNATREAYGLEPATSFAEITSDPEMQTKLETLYGSVDNIDLWVGGLVEDHVEGASMGETFSTIIVDQFERLRDGDRFWYQNVFSGEALRQIHRTSLSDVIERNTDLTNLQDDVFFFDSSISGTVVDSSATGLRQRQLSGLAGQLVQLTSDEGEVIAETTTDSRGRYEFDVLDGLRTGQYQVQLVSDVDGVATVVDSEELAITTGDVHLRGIDLTMDSNDDDPTDDEDESDEDQPQDRRHRGRRIEGRPAARRRR